MGVLLVTRTKLIPNKIFHSRFNNFQAEQFECARIKNIINVKSGDTKFAQKILQPLRLILRAQILLFTIRILTILSCLN